MNRTCNEDYNSSETYQLPRSTGVYQPPESTSGYQPLESTSVYQPPESTVVYPPPLSTGIYQRPESISLYQRPGFTEAYQQRITESIATADSFKGFVGQHKRDKTEHKQKPDRKPPTVRLLLYLLPDGAEIPKFTKQDPMIQTHQDQGYGYPSINYSDFIGHRSNPIPVSMTEGEFREQIRSLYHKLADKDFKLYTVDYSKKLIPAPFKPTHFIRYQGRVIIKIKKDTKAQHTIPEVHRLDLVDVNMPRLKEGTFDNF